MFEASRVLVIIRANDVDRFESVTRVHGGDPRVRVILDRRRPNSHRSSAASSEEHPPERRSTRAQHWMDGQIVVETGCPE